MSDFDGTLQRPTDPEAAAAAGTMNGAAHPPAEGGTARTPDTGEKGGLSEGQVLGREPLPDVGGEA